MFSNRFKSISGDVKAWTNKLKKDLRIALNVVDDNLIAICQENRNMEGEDQVCNVARHHITHKGGPIFA